MYTKSLVLVSTLSLSVLAQASSPRVLTCTFQKSQFGAPAVNLGAFEYKTKPGYLPATEGAFLASSKNLPVQVQSEIIPVPETGAEVIQTSIAVSVGSTVLRTTFSNEKSEQLSHVEIGSEGVVLCRAN